MMNKKKLFSAFTAGVCLTSALSFSAAAQVNPSYAFCNPYESPAMHLENSGYEEAMAQLQEETGLQPYVLADIYYGKGTSAPEAPDYCPAFYIVAHPQTQTYLKVLTPSRQLSDYLAEDADFPKVGDVVLFDFEGDAENMVAFHTIYPAESLFSYIGDTYQEAFTEWRTALTAEICDFDNYIDDDTYNSLYFPITDEDINKSSYSVEKENGGYRYSGFLGYSGTWHTSINPSVFQPIVDTENFLYPMKNASVYSDKLAAILENGETAYYIVGYQADADGQPVRYLAMNGSECLSIHYKEITEGAELPNIGDVLAIHGAIQESFPGQLGENAAARNLGSGMEIFGAKFQTVLEDYRESICERLPQWIYEVTNLDLEGNVNLKDAGEQIGSTLVGDCNMDGGIDLLDAVLLSKALTGAIHMTESQQIAMDCDGNGVVNDNDLTNLLQFIVKLIDKLPGA